MNSGKFRWKPSNFGFEQNSLGMRFHWIRRMSSRPPFFLKTIPKCRWHPKGHRVQNSLKTELRFRIYSRLKLVVKSTIHHEQYYSPWTVRALALKLQALAKPTDFGANGPLHNFGGRLPKFVQNFGRQLPKFAANFGSLLPKLCSYWGISLCAILTTFVHHASFISLTHFSQQQNTLS